VKKMLAIMFYPFAMIMGALAGGTAELGSPEGIRFMRDVTTDRSYDGQEIYDRIEHRKA